MTVIRYIVTGNKSVVRKPIKYRKFRTNNIPRYAPGRPATKFTLRGTIIIHRRRVGDSGGDQFFPARVFRHRRVQRTGRRVRRASAVTFFFYRHRSSALRKKKIFTRIFRFALRLLSRVLHIGVNWWGGARGPFPP